MALVPTTKPVGLFGGLDLKNDPKYVDAGRSLTAQNVRYPSVSRAEKRYGQSTLSNSVPGSGTLIQQGKALGAFGNELLAFDGSTLYAYGEGAGYWVNRGNLTETQLDVKNVTAGVTNAINVSAGSDGTVEFYAFEDANGNVYYSAKDSTSGTFFAQNALLVSGATAPVVVLTPTYAYVVANVVGVLYLYQFLLSSLGSGPVQQVNIGSVMAGTFHAMAYTNQQTLLITYISPAGLATMSAYNATTLILVGTQTAAATGAAAGARVSAGSITAVGNYLTAFTQPGVTTAPTLYFTAVSMLSAPTLTSMAQPASLPVGYLVDNVIIEASTTQNEWTAVCSLVKSPGNDQPAHFFVQGRFGTTIDVTSAPVFGMSLASQLAVNDGSFYWLCNSRVYNYVGTASQQPTYYLMRAGPILDQTGNIAAPSILSRFLSSQAYPNTGNPVTVSMLDTGLFYGLLYRAALRADSTGTLYTVNYITSAMISFPDVSGVQVVPFNGGALINCGLTYNYDGTQLVENGFWEFPDGINNNTDAPGSTYIYQYFVTYEWTDALGNVTLSAPSYAVVISSASEVGAGATHTLAVPYIALTRKSGVSIGVYRTAANSSSPAYKVGTVANVTTGAAAINFVDTVTDTVAGAGQRLYAPADFSGELENEPAPPFRYMVATKTRVFGIPQDNPYQIWYSKPIAYGRPAEFTPAQAIPIETAGGAVTALSALDTQAVVFKAQRLYYLPGDGPNAAGKPYNAFPPSLQLIASTTGCTSNQSVLATAEGLYFQSPTGLTQLTRGVQVNPAFGLPVQPLIQSLTLTGAQAVPAQNQLRWTSAEGTCVVYDYVTQRWSTYTNYDCVGYQPYGTTFARLRSDGRVWYEDTSTYLDDGAGVTMTIETAWLKPAELAQGFAAVWYATILGEYTTEHSLVVEVCYDYLDSAAFSVTFDASTYGNYGSYGSGSPYGSDPYYGSSASIPIYGTAYQPRVAMKRQVCEAVKFKIYDTSITGASCALNEIALQLGVIGGIKRVPATQQV